MNEPLSSAEVLTVLQELIRIPSINPTLVPGEKGEGAIATFARDWFEQRGVVSRLEEVAAGRPNVYAEVGRGEGRTLVLCAHIDTVSVAGMTIAPFEPKVEDGRVYGRGSYDMKGGVAAVMSAMADLAKDPPAGRVLAALVADEEYASLGAQDFVARHKADACIVTEPSEGKLILGHKGFLWAEVTTKGRAAHGSRWDLGVSAIGKMGTIIAALERFDREVLRARVHPLLGPASQHCALIEGGAGLSTYSESCTLKIERRSLPDETPEQILDDLRGVIADCGEEAEVRSILFRPPMVCDSDAPIAESLRSAIESVTGSAPPIAGVAYWMDAALFAAAGMATVNYGPTGAGAHEAIEWVDLDSVVTCAAAITEAARRFCN